MLYAILYAYAAVEVLFLLYFYLIVIPHIVHIPTKARPARDARYTRHRHKLFVRMVRRYQHIAELTGKCSVRRFENMVESYFTKKTSTSTYSLFSDAFSGNACTCTPKELYVHESSWENVNFGKDKNKKKLIASPSKEFVNTYRRENMNEFLAWAFFCKHTNQLSDWELEEIDECYKVMKDELNFEILPGKSDLIIPLRLNLDDPFILYRPLLFYSFVFFLKAVTWSVLTYCGFSRHRSSNGLSYWFRDDCDETALRQEEVPLVFFHGVSPGGLAMYLPFLFNCIGLNGRQAFLFESPGISMEMSMNILSEDDTANDIAEAIDRHTGAATRVQVIGHSFGTFVAAWFNHSFPKRVRQIVLLDPVSILVADNMVYQNFTFASGVHEAFTSSSRLVTFLLATTEAYMQYYLRRHFFWYNNELFFDDIDEHAKALLFLSMKDEILDANRVAEEVNRFESERQAAAEPEVKRLDISLPNSDKVEIERQAKVPKVKKFCWPDSKHGDFVMDRHTWKDIREAIEAQKATFVQTDEAKKER